MVKDGTGGKERGYRQGSKIWADFYRFDGCLETEIQKLARDRGNH